MSELTAERIKQLVDNRFQTAIDIQDACNPNGVSLTIHDTCRALTRGTSMSTQDIRDDPAVRLMVHKLADLCNVTLLHTLDYSDIYDQCRQKAKANETVL